MAKFTNLLKKNNTASEIDCINKLSLGSLYFVGSPIKVHNASEIVAMPVSIKQDLALFYFISAYRHDVLKCSNKNITIFSHNIPKSLARIVRNGNIKIDKKTAHEIVRFFTNNNTYVESVTYLEIKKRRIDFIDHITTIYNEEVAELNLHLIGRIIDVGKWPGVAIKKWAESHLKLGPVSFEYIYNYKHLYNRKSLMDTLQKHHTYSASKYKQNEQKNEGYFGGMAGLDPDNDVITLRGSDTNTLATNATINTITEDDDLPL